MIGSFLIKQHPRSFKSHLLLQMALSQQQAGCRIFQHIANAILRIFRVDWHISRTRLQDCQYRYYHLKRTISHNTNQLIRPHALHSKRSCELIGPFVQLAVGHALIPGYNRRMLRRTHSLLFEQTVDRAKRGGLILWLVEHVQNLSIFIWRQYAKLFQLRSRLTDDPPKQLFEVLSHTDNRLICEQGSCIFEAAIQPLLIFFNIQAHIEFGYRIFHRVRLHLKFTQRIAQQFRIVQGKHRVKQRIAA